MASLAERMIGAARLDVRTYEEVEADAEATAQAMLVVVLAALAAGLGTLGRLGFSGVVLKAVGALFGWFVWAWLTWLIGARLLPEPETRADMGQLLRTIGFSATPGLLRVLGALPFIGWLITQVANVWMLIAMVVAVRQALDYRSTLRAVVVCLIGFIVYICIQLAIGFIMLRTGLAGAVGPL
jgi:hypothetical protein